MKKITKRLLVLAAFLLILAGGCVWYVNDYYHSEGVEECLAGSWQVKVTEIEQGLFFDGEGEKQALIFYPGAKVEYTAYAPLLTRIAEEGMDCFLVKMPFNLAILGQNKADGILKEYTYEEWYLGGHSLGGAMAASYASDHADKLSGLVLLAAYPTKSLADKEISVLTIYGSEDQVLNRGKLEDGRGLMPKSSVELCIEGGNHAWFGNYGEQKGDGKASISREEQQRQTVEAISDMVR